MSIMLGLGLAGAALLGVGGHLSANETNKEAKAVLKEAQEMYDEAEEELEEQKEITESQLVDFGTTKLNIMNTTMIQFLNAYDQIKNIEFSYTHEMNEISKFNISQHDSIGIRKFNNVNQSLITSAATGAASGAIVALAVNGTLPIVTSMLSTAGTAVIAGEFGMAAGMTGSALSLGASMTPFAAFAAPALLFTGISASLNAEENLEKANEMYAEAELAVEKMETARVLYEAVGNRAVMHTDLLKTLDGKFLQCTALLAGLVKKKKGFFGNKKVDATNFTVNELKLVAITRSLAGAVKSIIDTPLLTEKGELSNQSVSIYKDIDKSYVKIEQQANNVLNSDLSFKPVKYRYGVASADSRSNQIISMSRVETDRRSLIGLLVGLVSSAILILGFKWSIENSIFVSSIISLLILDSESETLTRRLVSYLFFTGIAGSMISVFYKTSGLGVAFQLPPDIYKAGLMWGTIIILPYYYSVSRDYSSIDSSIKTLLVCSVGSVGFWNLALISVAFMKKEMNYDLSKSMTIGTIILSLGLIEIIRYGSDKAVKERKSRM